MSEQKTCGECRWWISKTIRNDNGYCTNPKDDWGEADPIIKVCKDFGPRDMKENGI